MTNSVVLMEKLVIKTVFGKKLVLQNIEIGYENFLKKLYSEIDNQIIKEDFIGFSTRTQEDGLSATQGDDSMC